MEQRGAQPDVWTTAATRLSTDEAVATTRAPTLATGRAADSDTPSDADDKGPSAPGRRTIPFAIEALGGRERAVAAPAFPRLGAAPSYRSSDAHEGLPALPPASTTRVLEPTAGRYAYVAAKRRPGGVRGA